MQVYATVCIISLVMQLCKPHNIPAHAEIVIMSTDDGSPVCEVCPNPAPRKSSKQVDFLFKICPENSSSPSYSCKACFVEIEKGGKSFSVVESLIKCAV